LANTICHESYLIDHPEFKFGNDVEGGKGNYENCTAQLDKEYIDK